ncbi:NAD(P)H-dependent flavin oxidoreductase YrpB, nitropropane dioxygenase family [Oryzisolibacter propanilivorax]|uniref:NAD(P)H-dependent flavin oxidoreductase YrpB, nitropropane dioxygenase family n=1 Tax=Oryzisolibacter propanilivorax TaxID=1527607 RepID=A0A1G9NVS3_9BURK|nr:nitronate monooxygenase [Oryzisolibacter propanilivorax]SDL90461.1 NAD(P)H-dependent flavin oxidoreductase YrpB, nitropropane dioxygenase family [Oryzisolibacter propanilivorax]
MNGPASELHTPLCELLGCRYPIVQTAMGWVAGADLVAATTNAGGFGFLAGATIAADRIEGEILKVKRLTDDRPFGLNFHMFQPNAQQLLDLAVKYRVRAVSYGRGPDKKVIGRLRDAGVVCMPTVGALKHALKAIEMGANAITVQGGEGGGHTGSVPTTVLLPQVVDAVQVPVIAAGGFYDGRGLLAALAYGAQGIAMGTRFLMTSDSQVPDATLQRYVQTRDAEKIAISYLVDGMPQRMIPNEYLTMLERASPLKRLRIALGLALQWKSETGMTTAQAASIFMKALREDSSSVAQTVMAANAPMLLQRSMVQGNPAEGVMSAGQVAALIPRLDSCESVISGIVRQALERRDALNRLTAPGPAVPASPSRAAAVA